MKRENSRLKKTLQPASQQRFRGLMIGAALLADD
jgi:hypothetical protein